MVEVMLSSGAGGNKVYDMTPCCICGTLTTRLCTDDDGVEGYVCQKCFLDGWGRLPDKKLPAPLYVKGNDKDTQEGS